MALAGQGQQHWRCRSLQVVDPSAMRGRRAPAAHRYSAGSPPSSKSPRSAAVDPLRASPTIPGRQQRHVRLHDAAPLAVRLCCGGLQPAGDMASARVSSWSSCVTARAGFLDLGPPGPAAAPLAMAKPGAARTPRMVPGGNPRRDGPARAEDGAPPRPLAHIGQQQIGHRGHHRSRPPRQHRHPRRLGHASDISATALRTLARRPWPGIEARRQSAWRARQQAGGPRVDAVLRENDQVAAGLAALRPPP